MKRSCEEQGDPQVLEISEFEEAIVIKKMIESIERPIKGLESYIT